MMKTLPETLPAFLWHFVREQPGGFLIYQLTALTWGIDQTIWPVFFKYLVDAINTYKGDPSGIFHYLSAFLWMGVALLIGVEVLFRIMGFSMMRVMPRAEVSIHKTVFEYVQLHSYRYFSDNFAGSIANKIGDISRSSVAAMQVFISTVPPVLLGFIIALILMARLQPLFAFILFAWFVVHMGISWVAAKGTARYSQIHSEARSTLSGKVIDSLSNFINVRMFARIPFEQNYIAVFREQERKANRATLFYMEITRFIIGVNGVVASIALVWFILIEWQKGAITVGDVVFLLTATWNIMTIVWHMGMQFLPGLYRDLGTCEQALSLIRAPHEIVDAPDARALSIKEGTIEFENVSFHYRKGRDIFSDKSLVIPGGQKVGLVGFSGGGKTTFVNLILRFFDVEEGRILIDGQDIAAVTQDSLRSQIAMIPQDTSLFHRTLMENIRYGNPDASDAEVIEVSKLAHCHEFIAQLDEDYNSLVGERGIKLSGGQRQRIAVARAMLKDAPILILDEATSSLDSITEKYIKESLGALMKGRTTLVIAHRLSTLADMDRILVFKEGHIVEDGPHEQLLALHGHYAKLWEMQAGGFLPEEEEE